MQVKVMAFGQNPISSHLFETLQYTFIVSMLDFLEHFDDSIAKFFVFTIWFGDLP